MALGGRTHTALRRARRAVAVLAVAVVLAPLVPGPAQAAESLPIPQLTGSPVSPSTVTDPVFTFTAAEGTTVCRFARQGDPLPAAEPCASPYAGHTTGDGTWVLYVQAVSGADTSPVMSTSYVRDATATATITDPPSPSGDRTPTWGVDVPSGATATCSVGGAPAQACAVSHTPAALSDGTHVLTVLVTGAQGATRVLTSEPYVLDATAPGAPAVTGMPATGRDTTGTWAWGSSAGDTAVCELLREGALVRTRTGCTAPASFSLTGEVAWSLRVTLTDAVGNVGAPGTSAPYALDTVAPPAPAFVGGPAGPSSSRTLTAVLDRSALDAADTVSCQARRDGSPLTGWVPATGSGATATCELVLAAGLADGVVDLLGRSEDPVGNSSLPTTGPSFVLDGTGPTTVVDGPRGLGAQTSPTWTFALEPGATAACRLDVVGGPLGPLLPCADGSVTAGPLTDDRYTLTVVQTDAQGNAGEPTVVAYEVDTTAPLAPIVAGPTGVGNDSSATWTWATGTGDSSRCRLVRAGLPQAELPCSNGSLTVVLPAEGSWQLEVLLADAVGNSGAWGTASGVSTTFVLDTVAPQAPAVSPQAPVGDDLTPVWTVTPAADAVTTTCRVYDTAGQPLALAGSCTAGFTTDLTGQPDGLYRLVVVSSDLAGNTSQASSDYELDTATPAAPTITGPSGAGSEAGSTWNIGAEPSSALTCRLVLDGAPQGWAPCSAPFTATLPTDGSWVLEVVQTDTAGLASPVGTSAPYLLDRQAPTPPAVTGPTGPAQLLTPTFTLSGTDGALTCAVTRDGEHLRGFAPCGSPFTLPLTSADVDGAYVVLVQLTDAAGNRSAVTPSAPYVLDRLAPRAPAVQGPAGPSAVPQAVWTWAPEPGGSSTCALLRDGDPVGAPFACTSGQGVALSAGDGAYALAVRVTDPAGNLGEAGTSGPYVLDTAPPSAPVVTATPALGASRAPLFSAVLAPDTASTTCRLIRPDGAEPFFTACALPRAVDLTGGPQGPYVLEVRALDVAGNPSATGSAAYLLDDVAPQRPVLQVGGAAGPADAPVGQDVTPTLSFSTDADVVATCRVLGVDGTTAACGAPGSPTGTYTPDLAGQPDGSYVLEVGVRDPAGNTSSSTIAYRLDRTAPAPVVFTERPSNPSSAAVWTWGWTVEPGAATTCALTGPGGAVALTGPCLTGTSIPTAGLTEGTWQLRLTATDVAGNASDTVTTQVLDRRAPALTVLAPAPTSGATPTWTITTDGDPTTLRCTLVRPGGVSEPVVCGAGYVLPDQGAAPVQGRYVLQVSVLSAAGVAASVDSPYELDTVAPVVVLDVGPTPSNDPRPVWTTTVSADATGLVSCAIVGPLPLAGPVPAGSPTRPCAWSGSAVTEADGGPLDFSAAGTDGRYLVLLQVQDLAGNRSALPTPDAPSGTWVRDSVVATIGTTLATTGNERAPLFDFTGVEAGATVSCTLLGARGPAAAVPCGPAGYRPVLLQDGPYTLTVTQTDPAGNTSIPSNLTYLLDTAAPDPLSLSLAQGPTSSVPAATWTFSSPDPSASYTCTLTSSTGMDRSGPCGSPYALDRTVLTADGAYTLAVVATDLAGNASALQAVTFTLDTVAPAAPVVGSDLPGIGRERQGVWTLRTDGSEAVTWCELLGEPSLTAPPLRGPVRCSPSTGYTQDLDEAGLGERDYWVRAVSVDDAGNQSPFGLSRPYRYDRDAQGGYSKISFPGDQPARDPDAIPPTAEQGYTNQALAEWRFRTAPGAPVSCSLSRVLPDRALVPVVPRDACVVQREGSQRFFTTTLPRVPGTDKATYRFVFTPGDESNPVSHEVVYDWDITRPVLDGDKAGNGGTTKWVFSAPETDANAVMVCALQQIVGGVPQTPQAPPALCDRSGIQQVALPTPGVWRLVVTAYDLAGNNRWSASSYTWDRTALSEPVINLAPALRGYVGQHRTLSWTFRVPPGVTASCTLTRNGSVVSPGTRACNAGSFGFSLTNQPPAGYALQVRLSQVNRGDSFAERSYQLLPRPQVVVPVPRPTTTRPTPAPSPRPDAPDTPPGLPTTPPASPQVPTITPIVGDLPAPPSSGPGAPGGGGGTTTGGGPEALDGGDGPSVSDLPGQVGGGLTRAVERVIDRPALPLALLAVVVMFLLVQNRIDRRDPKLAAAPVEGEPELGFGPTYRPPPPRGGGAAT